MGIQINIIVDNGGLLERSGLQQAANRQAFVEEQQRNKAGQAGKEQRLERLAEEGLDAQGNPQSSPPTSSRVERYSQEPAARRHGGLDIAYCRIAYKAQNIISILPKGSTVPTDFVLGESFNYISVISQITGNPMTSEQVLSENFRNPDTTYDTSQPEAWDPPFSLPSPLGSQSCYIGTATPIYSEDPNYGWTGEYTAGSRYERLIGYPTAVDRTMFLPAGNRTGVLLVRSHSYFYEMYDYRVQQARVFFSKWGETADYHFLQENSTVTFSSQITNTNGYELYITKAFYVTESSVREIAVPTAVEALLDTLSPLPIKSSLDVVIEDAGQEGVATCGGDYSTFPNEVFTIAPVSIEYTTTTYEEQPGITLETANLLRQFGIGALSSGNHNGSGFYSPAIYTFLSLPDPIASSQDTANNRDYAHVKDLLPRVPRRFVDVQLEEVPAGVFYRFRETRTMPENTTTPVNTRRLSGRFDIKVLEPELPDDYYSPWRSYIAWDWDASAYCRNKLELFGFDLSS